MRVLLFEQEYLGHYLFYLANLLPSLARLADEVVVAITPQARDSDEYREHLAPHAGGVDVQAVVPAADPSMRLMGRRRLLENLREAVRRFRPDYVLVPSGDGQTSFMGLYRVMRREALPGGVPGEVGIHFGYGPIGGGWRDDLKDLFYTQTQRLSPWRRIHYVNSTVYEWVRSRGGEFGDRAALMPDPVPANARLGKAESRRRLGIPEGGRYIGIAAQLDRRKAIDRLLAAFRSAAGPDDRLLLAGRMDPAFARLIAAEYPDLVARGRVVLMDRFLDRPTVDLIFDALDVSCIPHPRRGPISASLLHAVAAHRPVLVNDFGWMRTMVRRFEFGWACDVRDPGAFPRMIRLALDESGAYRESEATRRLLEFHAPRNFAATWLEGIRGEMGLPGDPGLRSWDWVLGALDQGHRALI